MSNLCIFCDKPTDEEATVEETVPLREKGCKSINEISKVKGDNKEVIVGQVVHIICRKNYCRKQESIIEEEASSSTADINLKETCFFCGEPAKLSDAKKRGYDVYRVRDKNFKATLYCIIAKRTDDVWASEIQKRIASIDLVGAAYHQVCNVNFRTNKQIPLAHGRKRAKKEGRPIDDAKSIAFQKMIEYVESNEGGSLFMSEISNMMDQECGEGGGFTTQYLKKKLLDHFGEDITIITKSGCSDLVLFRYSFEGVLSALYEQKKNKDNMTENQKIIKNAAKLIKSDVVKIPGNKDVYPTADDLGNMELQKSFLPESLTVMLKEWFTDKNHELKMVSIGQAIVQAIRPRALIAPLQFGLGVQVHHQFCSRFAVDLLHNLGFSSSYTEVQRFELCAASTVKKRHIEPNQIIKYAADNVDHDPRTIDGKNTLHGMGHIAAFTPPQRHSEAIVRAHRTIEDVKSIGTIEIKDYYAELHIDKNLTYEELPALLYTDLHLNIDFLIKITWPLRSERPSWLGTMQTIHHGAHPGNSSLTILPIIDMHPSDPTCIYSTLHFVAKEAKIYNVTPILTFDEPLWWKAYLIIRNEPEGSPLKSIVLLLGGFHLQMNFLGTIGYLMSGSGLQDVLELVYAPNSVTHILSGKAVSRAVRAHFLVDTVLNGLINDMVENSLADCDEWNSLMDDAGKLYDSLLSLHISPKDLVSNQLLLLIKEKIDFAKAKLIKENRTARLWLQYMKMVDILKNFLRGERTGDWALQLNTIKTMLPYFPVSGHNLYTKCAYIYLQNMAKLEKTHPDVYKWFSNGNHVIRRSDRFWAGLSCDLTIEQFLMRALKSRKGLTRGRGVNEDQRLIWVQSMPECAEINIAMQKITNLYFETSEQHKDCSEARKKRDEKDLQIIYDFLKSKNPFNTEIKALRNIFNGMDASVKVNADSAEELGRNIISAMAGQKVSAYTFKKVNKVVTMSDKNVIVIDGEVTFIDPQLLFQRLVLVARKFDEQKLEKIFAYELCQRPSSMFDDYGLMREIKKESFGDDIMKLLKGEEDDNDAVTDVGYKNYISGDWLVDIIPWKLHESFSKILLKYASYIESFDHPCIIFDVLTSEPTIKNESILRRSKGGQAVNCEFTSDTLLNTKKEMFLANNYNRQRFIKMLGDTLLSAGCKVAYAAEANSNIALMAAQSSNTYKTAVIGDNIDLLALLIHFYKENCHDLIFRCATEKIYNIKSIKGSLGDDISRHILLLHALSGCKGSTSYLFGIGKGVALRKYQQHKEMANFAEVFYVKNVSETEIVDAGNRALKLIYNGDSSDSLDSLRFRRFSEKVARGKSVVLIQSLPPTSAAAKYHLLRVYLQVQVWIGNDNIIPEDYGWVKKGTRLKPITTDLEPAPHELLITIRCRCQGSCDTNRCSCKKNNLKCSTACTECFGTNCFNQYSVPLEEEEEGTSEDL